jgi:hypothetical protein
VSTSLAYLLFRSASARFASAAYGPERGGIIDSSQSESYTQRDVGYSTGDLQCRSRCTRPRAIPQRPCPISATDTVERERERGEEEKRRRGEEENRGNQCVCVYVAEKKREKRIGDKRERERERTDPRVNSVDVRLESKESDERREEKRREKRREEKRREEKRREEKRREEKRKESLRLCFHPLSSFYLPSPVRQTSS